VHIFPFKMTAENMKKYKDDKNISFWKELAEGYEAFERDSRPPKMLVNSKGELIIKKSED